MPFPFAKDGRKENELQKNRIIACAIGTNGHI